MRRAWRVGVDEAGRGSLVGEMIVAAYAVPSDRLEALRLIGVDDSKRLSPREREELYWELARIGVFRVVAVPPEEIDRVNLNELTVRAVVEAVSGVVSRIEGVLERVVVDKFGDPVRVAGAIRRAGVSAPVIVEERADARYPEVSAASIIAKYIRDRRMEVLRSLYGVRGSGYPSDPETVRWVMEVLDRGERPRIIRYSWGTLKGTEAYRPKTSGRRRVIKRLDEFLR